MAPLVGRFVHAAEPLIYPAVGIGMLIVGGFLGRWYGLFGSRCRVFHGVF